MHRLNVTIEHLTELLNLSPTMSSLISHAAMVLLTIVVAAVVDWLCRRLIMPLTLKIVTHTENEWDNKVFSPKVTASICHVISAVVVWMMLPLAFEDYPTIEEALRRFTAIYITVMVVRTSIVFVDALRYAHPDKNVVRQQYFMSFSGVFKIIAVFVAVIIILAIALDKSPMTLLAGLGATSAILVLIFKDTIEGFVAGVRLTSNDMIHIGDWITVPTTQANGIVEEITLSTVKIRNFDNTVITVSPQALLSGSFQNRADIIREGCRRANRIVYYDFNTLRVAEESLIARLKTQGYLVENFAGNNERRDTDKGDEGNNPLTNITLYRRYIETMLRRRSDINPDMFLIVRQKEVAECGLPLEFVFFVRATDITTYEHLIADIMEWIYATAAIFDLKIYQQFPVPASITVEKK